MEACGDGCAGSFSRSMGPAPNLAFRRVVGAANGRGTKEDLAGPRLAAPH